MEYSKRYQELNNQFKLGIDTHLTETDIDIRHFCFQSEHETDHNNESSLNSKDDTIIENQSFVYPVFMPACLKRADKAILLLHGLNERNWNKYLTWAEYLCAKTGKPVILFPIAFHMNRSPLNWSNPRALQNIMNVRRQVNGEDRSLSFANVALSERISEKPYRFYSSGRQSVNDLTALYQQIKQGKHALFNENTHIDIFAYSIGAFLAQITMLANPLGLFSASKLFLFCGGGIFSSMVGQSRSIMDKLAFKTLYDYYLNQFIKLLNPINKADSIFNSFNTMISSDRNQAQRENFFSLLGNNLKGISLYNDKVMLDHGIPEALGAQCAVQHIARLDFSFPYTHENPFPVSGLVESSEVDAGFLKVFTEIARFFS
jgi:pimeloyl-ACP methyl ester carboxylesterase